MAALAIVLAVVVGNQFSILYGFLLFLLLIVGLLKLVYNFDYWIVRRMLATNDNLMMNLFESGFVSRVRWLVGNVPAMPPLFDTLWWRREVDRDQAF